MEPARQDRPTAAAPATPIVVLGAGQRCGSTLIQRLLCSHPDVMIWGEHLGQLRELLAVGASLRDWSQTLGRRARDMFGRDGYQSFIANLTPETEHVDDAVRGFVRRLFADPAAGIDRPVWGFKEVRYGRPEADDLARLFPGLAIVYVIRDPRDVLRSLDEWERRGEWTRTMTESSVACWHRVAASFLDLSAGNRLPVLSLRFENLVADPLGATAAIAAHTGLDPARFDARVFQRRISGIPAQVRRTVRDWDELAPSLRELLDADGIREVAAAHGYHL
jgi:hypothetical protein